MLLLFEFVALPAFFSVALLFCLNRDMFWYFTKMTLFYACIMASSFLTCFGAVATYFRNEGCIVAMYFFHLFASQWLDISVEIRGAEKIEQASGPNQNPVVIISNHQSSLDLFTMSKMWPSKCTAMMKYSLKYIPFFNIGAILSNSIFVDRSSKENAKEALNESIRKMVEKKLKIWVFPEGTRHHNHGLLPFKKGAFNIAVGGHFTIIPVVISDYTPFYSKPMHYFRPQGHVVVQVMDPVPTDKLTNDDVLELCERVQKSMAEVYEIVSKDADQVMQERSTKIAVNGNNNNK